MVSTSSSSSAERPLTEEEWYWPGATRAQLAELLATRPDGTFAVRDASTPGDYTLTLQFGGQTKLIRIYVVSTDGHVGFSPADVPAPQWTSLRKLIEHHRRNSLASYNAQLDVCLIQPLVNPSSASPPSHDVENSAAADASRSSCPGSATAASPEVMPAPGATPDAWEESLARERWRATVTDAERAARFYDLVHEEVERAARSATCYGTLEQQLSFNLLELRRISEEQQRQKSLSSEKSNGTATNTSSGADDSSEAVDNRKSLELAFEGNLAHVEKMIAKLEEHITTCTEKRADAERIRAENELELESARQRVVSLHGLRNAAAERLTRAGYDKTWMPAITAESERLVRSEPVAHVEPLVKLPRPAWDLVKILVNDASHDMAARLITAQRAKWANEVRTSLGESGAEKHVDDGIFLIRPSRRHSDKLVLSVLCADKIAHCLIEWRPTEGWGFESSGTYLPCLADFIRYYSHFSLEKHNPDVRTALTRAALA